MKEVQLYHPKLQQTYVAPSESAAAVLKKSGWTDKIPASAKDDEKKEA